MQQAMVKCHALTERMHTIQKTWCARYLSCSVNDLGSILLSLMADRLGERILDRGVVGVHKHILHELDCHRRFAFDYKNKWWASE